jgi:ABC-type phosphate transport system substrate-binding protein
MIASALQSLRAAAAATLLLWALPLCARADIYVIVNSRLTLTTDDIKGIYTGDKQLAGSTKITPLDNTVAKSEFLSKVLQLDPVKYDALWIKKSFRDGINPPLLKASDEEVVATVKSTAGTIGYISTAPPDGVTVLKRF